MNEKLSKILMDGIEDMYNIMKAVGEEDFNENDAKMKIAANNSMTTTAKTLIQHELLKVATANSSNNTKRENKKLLGE